MSRNLSPASREQHRRQASNRVLHQWTDGIDLVAMALENPLAIVENGVQRGALFGRIFFGLDQMRMVRKITDRQCDMVSSLMERGAQPEGPRTLSTVDCWKLIICDGRAVENSAHLEREYRAQLQAEERQTPLERAREAVRTDTERMARRNARLMIPALEKLSPEKFARLMERNTLYTIWEKVAPKPPTWITDITDDELPWGYVFYKTTQVDDRVGNQWEEALERLEGLDEIFYGETLRDQPIFVTAGPDSIHSPGESFMEFWTTVWADAAFSDDDMRGVRDHFREYRNTLDSSAGVLSNTFIMVTSECLHPDLLTVKELNELPQSVFWVWACDAEWDPPSTAGQHALASDQDGYQGRVKVPFVCLQAWFYAARLKDVNMKKMWEKAQRHPEQLWVCNSKPQQEWKHEPYI